MTFHGLRAVTSWALRPWEKGLRGEEKTGEKGDWAGKNQNVLTSYILNQLKDRGIQQAEIKSAFVTDRAFETMPWFWGHNNSLHLNPRCYSENVCVSSEFICWSPKPQCDGTGSGGFGCLDREGGALVMGIVPSQKRLFHQVSVQQEDRHLWTRSKRLPDTDPDQGGHLGLGLLAFQNGKI